MRGEVLAMVLLETADMLVLEECLRENVHLKSH